MNQPRILIVDDEPLNIDYLEQELSDKDFDLISASNGQEALEKIHSQSPDLVLLDIMMPIMDGYAVLDHLKADPETRGIPVIVISANNDLQYVVKGIKKGAEDYLPKPFEPTILHARIATSLDRKRLRDQEKLYLQSLENELSIARNIQKEFLPTDMPNMPGWDIAAFFKAAKFVAGDYYDAFPLPDGNLMFLVGDVCGKGVGAALFMTLFRSLLRATATAGYLSEAANSANLSPATRIEQAVNITNRYIVNTHYQTATFSTIFIAVLDIKDGTLTYINGGNEAPLLLRAGGLVEHLEPTSPVIGFMPDARFNIHETRIDHGDSLLAFTDGIPDCRNPAGETFGHERTQAFIKQADANSAERVNRLGTELETFIDTADQFDDITILAVRRL